MDTSSELFVPYFYLLMPIIYKLRVLVPSTYFEVDYFITINVSSFQILQDGYSFKQRLGNVATFAMWMSVETLCETL